MTDRLLKSLKLGILTKFKRIISNIDNKNISDEEGVHVTVSDNGIKSAIEYNVDRIYLANNFNELLRSLGRVKEDAANKGWNSEFYPDVLKASQELVTIPEELEVKLIKLAVRKADINFENNIPLLTKGVAATSARILLNNILKNRSILQELFTNKQNSPAFQKAIEEGIVQFTEPQEEKHPFIRDSNVAAEVANNVKNDPSIVGYIFSFIEKAFGGQLADAIDPKGETIKLPTISIKRADNQSTYITKDENGLGQSMPLAGTGPTNTTEYKDSNVLDSRIMDLGGDPPVVTPVANDPGQDLIKKLEKIKQSLKDAKSTVFEGWENSFKHDEDLAISFSQLHKKVRNLIELTDMVSKNIKPKR